MPDGWRCLPAGAIDRPGHNARISLQFSEFALLPVVGLTAGMSNSDNDNSLTTNEECNVVRESGKVDAAVATRALTPQKRLADDGSADTLDLGANRAPNPVIQRS